MNSDNDAFLHHALTAHLFFVLYSPASESFFQEFWHKSCEFERFVAEEQFIRIVIIPGQFFLYCQINGQFVDGIFILRYVARLEFRIRSQQSSQNHFKSPQDLIFTRYLKTHKGSPMSNLNRLQCVHVHRHTGPYTTVHTVFKFIVDPRVRCQRNEVP